MKRSVVAFALIFVLLAASSAAYACGSGSITKYATKTYLKHTIVMKYTSYKDADGVRKVKDGSITRASYTKLKDGLINIRLYDKGFGKIDSGRTYNAHSTFTFNLEDGTLKTSTGYCEFGHIRSDC